MESFTLPATREELVAIQDVLAAAAPEPWSIPSDGLRVVAGCFVCYAPVRPGAGGAGDRAWAAAVLIVDGRLADSAVVPGIAPAAYEPGLMALREGPLLEAAIRRLSAPPEVLLVNATGRDHPRRAGLALHLGARLDLPTVGVTRRPLIASGDPPSFEEQAVSPLRIGEEIIGFWLRTRRGRPPLAVHAGWRTDPHVGVAVVRAVGGRWRTPPPLREARRLARQARYAALSEPTGFMSSA